MDIILVPQLYSAFVSFPHLSLASDFHAALGVLSSDVLSHVRQHVRLTQLHSASRQSPRNGTISGCLSQWR